MGSGTSKPVYRNDIDLGQFFCGCIVLASIDAENETNHFVHAFASWRGIVEVGLRHLEVVVSELGEWVACRSDGGAPPPDHWNCVQTEKRFGGTELLMRLYGGVEITLFVPSPTAEGNEAAERWHKVSGNLARDVAALRHARWTFISLIFVGD